MPGSTNSQAHRTVLDDSSAQLHLMAGFLALATLVIATRVLLLALTTSLMPYIPLVAYQDVVVLALIIWTFFQALRIVKRPAPRRLMIGAGWVLCIALAIYTVVDEIIYILIRSPLTYRLLVVSQNMAGVGGSISDGLHVAYRTVPVALLFVVLFSEFLRRFAPSALANILRGVRSHLWLIVVFLYGMVGHVWAVRYIAYPPTVANPEWAFVSSLFQTSRPMITDHIPPEYLADFLSPDKTVHSTARPAMFDSRDLGPQKPPLNVLMVVMESVGARRLHLYGAPYNDTPELDALARHGLVFDRIYVSQTITSAAMAALFCSVYPYHGWFTVSRYAPDLRVPGLPEILANRGYRTAFIHSGQLFYDHNDDFLTNHGFKDLEAEHRDFDSPRDEELVGKAVDWIKADPSKPFFLALWTQDTHHPYLATSNDDYHVSDPSLNRELNTVHSTDALIGRLARQLDRMGLSDNTLIVVTGDHGEAFGEHGQLIHGFTVYEEESRIPLLIANPQLIPNRVDITRVGRQIDIAPTILSILGIDEPIEWQGASLFENDSDRRAYLFSADGNFTLGLVDGDWKFIYDFNRDSAQLYNLETDPGEKHNLSGNPIYSAMVARDHLRLEAWLSFQNNYLERFTSADKIAKPKLQ